MAAEPSNERGYEHGAPGLTRPRPLSQATSLKTRSTQQWILGSGIEKNGLLTQERLGLGIEGLKQDRRLVLQTDLDVDAAHADCDVIRFLSGFLRRGEQRTGTFW